MDECIYNYNHVFLIFFFIFLFFLISSRSRIVCNTITRVEHDLHQRPVCWALLQIQIKKFWSEFGRTVLLNWIRIQNRPLTKNYLYQLQRKVN